MHLFVYGTLKPGFGNNVLLNGARLLGPAKTRGTMYSYGWFPFITQEGDGHVQGYVYEIDENHLRVTDRLEGYRGNGGDNFYDRVLVPCDLVDEGTTLDAFTYVRPDNNHEYYRSYPRIEDGNWRTP